MIIESIPEFRGQSIAELAALDREADDIILGLMFDDRGIGTIDGIGIVVYYSAMDLNPFGVPEGLPPPIE